MVASDAADSWNAALPELHVWPDRPNAADLAPLPGCPAIYVLLDAGGTPVQLATTQSLKRLLISRLTDPARLRPGQPDLAEITRGVRWRPLATAFEGRWWYYRLARTMYPQEYRRLISFGPAYFLHVDWDHPVPELRVTERVFGLSGQFVGPWPSHKACQEALEGLWDLFDLCRYPEQVRKTPHGTRCAYAEMGRCDAPCDGSVPLAAYAARCRAAWRFATGGVEEWLEQAEARMRRSAAHQQFELAGQIKQQLRFAHAWQTEWAPHLRTAEGLNYFIALPVTRRRAWKLLAFRGGDLADGPIVPERSLGRDAVAWLAQQMASAPTELPAALRMEQAWLLSHLFFSRERESAVIVPLATATPPTELERTVGAQAAAVRDRSHRQATSSAADVAQETPTKPSANT
jgi:DNA polymerase-3 subunit epsilon